MPHEGGCGGVAVVGRGPGSVKDIGGHAFHRKQFLNLLKGRMRRLKRRSQGKIVGVELAAGSGGAAPVDDGGGNGERPPGVHSQGREQLEKIVDGNFVQVQFGRFGDDLDVVDSAGKIVIDRGRVLGDEGGALGNRPEQLHGGLVHAGGCQVVAAQIVDRGSGAVDFPAHRDGHRKGDGSERSREPQHGEQRTAALGGAVPFRQDRSLTVAARNRVLSRAQRAPREGAVGVVIP